MPPRAIDLFRALSLALFNAERISARLSATASPEDLPHIFDPFYQSAKKRTSGEHAGLGLAIAKCIMTLQQGEIRVDSTPGSGSTFTFLLPLAVVLMPAE